MMQRLGSRWGTSRSRSRPLRSGRLTSSSNKSKGLSSSLRRPSSAVPASETSKFSEVRRASSPSRISTSSSTTRIVPLGIYGFPSYRKLQAKRSALAGDRTHIHFAGVFFDDSVAHGEAQPGALAGRLRGKERVENAVQIFRRYAGARIGDFDFDGT